MTCSRLLSVALGLGAVLSACGGSVERLDSQEESSSALIPGAAEPTMADVAGDSRVTTSQTDQASMPTGLLDPADSSSPNATADARFPLGAECAVLFELDPERGEVCHFELEDPVAAQALREGQGELLLQPPTTETAPSEPAALWRAPDGMCAGQAEVSPPVEGDGAWSTSTDNGSVDLCNSTCDRTLDGSRVQLVFTYGLLCDVDTVIQ